MDAIDRFNMNSQLEHLQAKHVGTGHADMNKFEWAVNIRRDSYASNIQVDWSHEFSTPDGKNGTLHRGCLWTKRK